MYIPVQNHYRTSNGASSTSSTYATAFGAKRQKYRRCYTDFSGELFMHEVTGYSSLGSWYPQGANVPGDQLSSKIYDPRSCLFCTFLPDSPSVVLLSKFFLTPLSCFKSKNCCRFLEFPVVARFWSITKYRVCKPNSLWEKHVLGAKGLMNQHHTLGNEFILKPSRQRYLLSPGKTNRSARSFILSAVMLFNTE